MILVRVYLVYWYGDVWGVLLFSYVLFDCLTIGLKKEPIKPKKIPICHMLKPVIPIWARIARQVSPKNHPTIHPKMPENTTVKSLKPKVRHPVHSQDTKNCVMAAIKSINIFIMINL